MTLLTEYVPLLRSIRFPARMLPSTCFDGAESYVLSPTEIEVEDEVAQGITSKVYLGKYRGIAVAVKRMNHARSSMSGKSRVNFARELQILKQINHPNLVQFVGVAEEAGTLMLVTQFCWGDTVFDLAHNSDLKLSCHQYMKIASDVSSGMAYLHSFEPPIIHRDLKSLNLLLHDFVDSEETVPLVKITDFGLSRSSTCGGIMTKEAGTLHWMAPEVLSSAVYDERIDVYSYAMILFEVICQKIPFAEVEAHHLLALRVVAGSRPNLDSVPDTCPHALRCLMVSCWAQDPDERPDFNSIVEMLSQMRV